MDLVFLIKNWNTYVNSLRWEISNSHNAKLNEIKGVP